MANDTISQANQEVDLVCRLQSELLCCFEPGYAQLSDVLKVKSESAILARELQNHHIVKKLMATDRFGFSQSGAEMARTITKYVRRLARDKSGRHALRAVADGDFALQNLFFSHGAVHPVGILRGYWFRAARIAAQFLVAKDTYRDIPEGQLWCGLNMEENTGFLRGAGCRMIETDPGLRLITTEQLAARIIERSRKSRRRSGIQKRIEHLIPELVDRMCT